MISHKPAIFINYRRSDTGGHGRALHEYLSGCFGNHSVFFDRSTIESGDIFPDTLRQGVEGCACLLALIGPEWLDVRGNDGNRRLDDPQDFVRREIALALEQGKKVIPVLFDETLVPARDRLPDPFKALASYDPLTLRGKTHEYQAQRRKLVERLAEVPGVPEPQPEPDEAFAGHEKIARWRKMAMDVQSKIDSMDNANQEELEDVLHVLERHPDYLDFDNAVKSELRDPHKEHGLTPYGRTAYIGTVAYPVVPG